VEADSISGSLSAPAKISPWAHLKERVRAAETRNSELEKLLAEAANKGTKPPGLNPIEREHVGEVIRQAHAKNGELQKRLEEVTNSNANQQNLVNTYQNVIIELQQRLEMAKLTLEENSLLIATGHDEQHAVEEFYSTAGPTAVAECTRMVRQLNEEIVHFAPTTVYQVQFADRLAVQDSVQPDEEARRYTIFWTSERWMGYLSSTPHHRNPIVVQLALQNALSKFFVVISQVWYTSDPKLTEILAWAHSRVKATGTYV
jgi:hypothetical protein